MSLAVVDQLEMVHIEDDQGEGVAVAPGGGDRLLEVGLEGALVGKVGQAVAGGALEGKSVTPE
jgi:hypothetical protein